MSVQCDVLISCFPKWMTVKLTVAQSCPTLCDHMDCSPWNSPGQYTGVGSHSLLQGVFPTHGSNPGLLHCRWIIYQLSHKGSPPKWIVVSHFSLPILKDFAKVGLPLWLNGKESACNTWDLGLIHGLGRSPGEGNGYPLQYSGLGNSMDCTVDAVAKSWKWLSGFHSYFHLPKVHSIEA